MFYLFIDGKTRTMGASVSQLENFYREMYMTEEERTVTVKDDDGGETVEPAPLPENVKIAEYNGGAPFDLLSLGADGNVVESEPPKPTDEQVLQDKINALDAQFNADKTELVNQYAEAVAVGDTDTAKDVQAQLSELFAEYDKQYTAITGGEEDDI